jgi:hypothetical protein
MDQKHDIWTAKDGRKLLIRKMALAHLIHLKNYLEKRSFISKGDFVSIFLIDDTPNGGEPSPIFDNEEHVNDMKKRVCPQLDSIRNELNLRRSKNPLKVSRAERNIKKHNDFKEKGRYAS